MNSPATITNEQEEAADHDHQDRRQASIAVIIPVRNEERYLAATLDQLLKQDREGLSLEIIVVDGRSEDKTREIARLYAERNPEVRLLDNPLRLSSAARNLGIEHSSGEYIVIVDGHCEIPTQTYLIDLIAAFQSSGADCLGRPQPQDVSKATSLQLAIAAARSSRLGHHPDSFIYSEQEVDCPAMSVAVAYRRKVFEKVGLFDTSFDACEDCELNHRIDRAGLRCRLIPRLAIKYEPRTSLVGLFRQLFRYGRGRVRLSRKHAETFTLAAALPACLVAGIMVGPWLSLAVPFLWPFYWTGLSVYFMALVLESTRLAVPRKSLGCFFQLFGVFIAVHFGAGCGVLRELFSRRPAFS